MAGLLTVPSQFGFSRDDLERMVATTFVERVEFHQSLRSTNDRALELAGLAAESLPLLVLAESQTGGRGRGANRWWTETGALTFSLLVAAESYQLPPHRWPQVALTAGLAVAEAIGDVMAEPLARIKWPNDVYLLERKVSGILVEVPRQSTGALVVGIGLNVNNDLSAAPADVRESAISLREVLGRVLPLPQVLTCVLLRMEERLQGIGRDDDEARLRWRQRCLLTGRPVRLRTGQRDIAGLCRGIDDEGALIVDTREGRERCFAGVVTDMGAAVVNLDQ